MNIIEGKNIAVLGFGRHGGGLSSTKFALSQSPSSVTIIDKATTDDLEEMISSLGTQRSRIAIGQYEPETMQQYDIVIKNPAIPHHAEILAHINKIETDISLYYQYQATPTWMITGTKGKSSVSTALYNLLTRCSDVSASLSGNITSSPLNILLHQEKPDKIVLEASSFQLGDLTLVQKAPFEYMELMVLTNLMHDHLNYYSNMREYVADKLVPFHNMTTKSHAILPYSPKTVCTSEDEVQISLYENILRLPIPQCYFHAQDELPESLIGCYSNAEGIYARNNPHEPATLLIPRQNIPAHLINQNLCIICSAYIAQPHIDMSLPKSMTEWEEIFTVPHRKEKIAVVNGRTFYNDSSATIPQAIQLSLFMGKRVHLITGGTDKKLVPQDLLPVIASAHSSYLLGGTYTEKVIPLLQNASIPYKGPFSNLEDAVYSAYKDSQEGDIIILSPGCASFGMFLHEFDRGNQFKKIVGELV